MNTQNLIDTLVADGESIDAPIGTTVALALAFGLVLSVVAFVWQLGWRPDIGQASQTVRFLFKFVVTLAALIPAIALAADLARPDANPGAWGWALLIAPILLIGGVSAELLILPANAWTVKLIGTNARICLTVIPLLAIAPLAALLFALRRGAPSEPRLAGAVAGIAAGAMAATLYAFKCTDDSPLFVATWYTIAIGVIALAGSLIGERALRW